MMQHESVTVNLMIPQCQDQMKKWKRLWVKMVVAPIQWLDPALLCCDLWREMNQRWKQRKSLRCCEGFGKSILCQLWMFWGWDLKVYMQNKEQMKKHVGIKGIGCDAFEMIVCFGWLSVLETSNPLLIGHFLWNQNKKRVR